jgi:hypothetical protein
MRYLYQKDERVLPGNLRNRKYNLFFSYSKFSVSHYFPTPFFSLSLSLLVSAYSGDLQLKSQDYCLEISIYPEDPGTGHLDTRFLGFPPCSSKCWDGFKFQVATPCFSN